MCVFLFFPKKKN
jgi:hypothetical protein